MNTVQLKLLVVAAAFMRPGEAASVDRGNARAREPKLARFTFIEPHMGTRFKIVLYAPDEATANHAAPQRARGP